MLDKLQAPSSSTELDTQLQELLSALKQLWPDDDACNATAVRIQLAAMAVLLREEELCLDSSDLASLMHEELGDVEMLAKAAAGSSFALKAFRSFLCSTGLVSYEEVFVDQWPAWILRQPCSS